MLPFFPSLPHIEPCAKRIRVYVKGVCIIDTKRARLVWQTPYYPHYFFEEEDLPQWYTNISATNISEPDAHVIFHDIWLGNDPKTANAITLYKTGPLKGLASVKFEVMEAWFEEDEQIFIHPRDPYKRVDILQSSRHVRVEVNGIEIANTKHPRLLFETGLPMRTYIPKTDCRMDLWEESTLTTGCPYKGEAKYYSVVLSSGERFENIVWWYPNTTTECLQIRGFVAFFDEKVDVWIDGEKQERPKSLYSSTPN